MTALIESIEDWIDRAELCLLRYEWVINTLSVGIVLTVAVWLYNR